MTTSILDMKNVTMRFGGVTAVNNLNLKVEKGSITGLIGPNGAGKTTVFNLITGFYHPQEGDISFCDASIKGLPPYAVCKAGMARTFQNIRLFTNLSVLENVMIGRHVRRKSSWWEPIFYMPKAVREEQDMREQAMHFLKKLGIASYANDQASSLPYGAQRMLEIARAMATQPKFLLLDEPAAGMNPQESSELLNFIKRIRDEFDLSILLIEHDMKVVMNVCQHIYVLEYGQLIAQGNADEIRSNARVIEAYLGQTD